MSDLDVAVVGAGHNGLIAAAYLARAGLRVAVYERRDIAGGTAATEEMAPGIWVDRLYEDHALLHTTPIPGELGLAQYGLEYVASDATYFAPRLNDEGLIFWQDLERTCDGIAARSRADARAYRRFVRQWCDVFEWAQPALLGDPNPRAVVERMVPTLAQKLGAFTRVPLLQRARKVSIADLLDETFEDMHLKGVLAFLVAGALGLSPNAPGSALLAPLIVVPHLVGTRRPRGGGRALVAALVAAIEAGGGHVRTGATVERIAVADGAVRGVHLEDGAEVQCATVVAACDPQTTFLRLLDHQAVPPRVRAAVERIEIANGFAMKADFVIDRLPEWKTHSRASADVQVAANTIICPSLEYLQAAFRDYQKARSPRWPALLVSVPSVGDPGRVRDGSHLLTVHARYVPYQLDGGVTWHSVRQQEGERLFTFLQQYAPNLAGAERLRIIQTPEDLARDLALPRAHSWHLDANERQLGPNRPIRELAGYRTPIRGLYLTGAGTHPGGGVWGAPGRNTAHVVLDDFG